MSAAVLSPTPNQVSTAVSGADDKISLFNLSGTVDVITDVTACLTPADPSQMQGQIDASNSTVSSLQATTSTRAQVDTGLAGAAACKGFPNPR